MATIYGSWATGLRIKIVYTQSKNVIGNYSTVTVNYYLEANTGSGYTWRNETGNDAWWQIDSSSGEWAYQKFNFHNYSSLLLKTKSYTIYHGSDGKASIRFYVDFYTGLGDYGCNDHITYSGTTTLESIDRAAPTVTAQISNVSVNSLMISAGSNVACDIWQYMLEDGSNWVTFSTTSGKSASVQVTGLKANTNYIVKVRARRAYNQVYGTSASYNVKTLGGAVYVSNGKTMKKAICYVNHEDSKNTKTFKVALVYVFMLGEWKLTEF